MNEDAAYILMIDELAMAWHLEHWHDAAEWYRCKACQVTTRLPGRTNCPIKMTYPHAFGRLLMVWHQEHPHPAEPEDGWIASEGCVACHTLRLVPKAVAQQPAGTVAPVTPLPGWLRDAFKPQRPTGRQSHGGNV